MADINSTVSWDVSWIVGWCLNQNSWHVQFADAGVVICEYVHFGFDVSDGLTVVGHWGVWRVGIRGTVQNLDDFPHIWAAWIWHCILKEIFATFCLGLVYSLCGFKASINPLLSVLMDCSTEAISIMDFSSHMWSHSRFTFLDRFCFPIVDCCSRDDNIIETRNTGR